MNQPKILGLILARGGSKSIPKKSIYPCAGKELLYYTIKSAQASKSITRLIITTDDEEITEVAKKYGVEVPFMRPKELAEDLTPDLPVFEHTLKWLKENENYEPDAIVHLRPTSPIRSGADIDAAVQMLLENSDAESVRSVVVPPHTPFKLYRHDESEKFLKPILIKDYPDVFEKYPEPYNMPRQVLPPTWKHCGYVDVLRPNVVTEKHSMSGKNIMPLKIANWRDIDIDNKREFRETEDLIKKIRIKLKKEPWDDISEVEIKTLS